ncbi:hypothetical protein [Thalassomonas sp. RHCl1]|uniref:hypothetical protein n=1 Tax=Thalassomonas sp. RHCl1 TaxID=2995320 RepID=UPI00248A9DB8|nr:hypothetical protein [Thalassomonas sp. RHCl1]
MKKITMTLLASAGMVFSATSIAGIYQNPGTVEFATRMAIKHSVIDSSRQHREQEGWMNVATTDEGATSGFYQAQNWFRIHKSTVKIGSGLVSFEFDPAKLDCTQGFSFNLEVGEDTVAVFKPDCDDLLNASVSYPVSHTFDLIPEVIKPKVAVPLDPLGLVQVGVKFGIGVEVGADFTVGGVIGGYDNDQPFESGGVRRPDYIYASVEPYISGQVDGAAYTTIGHGIAEAGVKGKLNLVTVKSKGYMEAGIRRVEVDEDVVEQGFLELKISGELSGGDGKVDAYCHKLWGLIKFNTNLMKWDPLYRYEHTFFDYASPVWETL